MTEQEFRQRIIELNMLNFATNMQNLLINAKIAEESRMGNAVIVGMLSEILGELKGVSDEDTARGIQ